MAVAGLPYRGATRTVANAILQAINLAYRRRLNAVATVAALRAVPSRGASATIKFVPNALTYVSAAGTCYRWEEASGAADDGSAVIAPSDIGSSPGRWLRQATSTLLLDDATPINAAQTGYLKNVVYYDGERSTDEFDTRIYAQRPCVVVDFLGREKQRKSTTQGGLAWATYRFHLDCISFNAREGDRGFRGGTVAAEQDADPGAWAIAEDLENLLDGATGEQLGVSAIAHCRVTDLDPVENDLSGRKAVTSILLEVFASIGHKDPDSTPLTSVTAQLETSLDRQMPGALDGDNCIVEGLNVTLGFGRSRAPTTGSARIAGALVTVGSVSLHTFGAGTDTYRDLNPDGTFSYHEVVAGAPAPSVTASALRIGRTRTDSASIVEDELLASTQRNYGSQFQIAP